VHEMFAKVIRKWLVREAEGYNRIWVVLVSIDLCNLCFMYIWLVRSSN
jgi:hypothetical protein